MKKDNHKYIWSERNNEVKEPNLDTKERSNYNTQYINTKRETKELTNNEINKDVSY